jgi:hypothetical protein
MSPPLQHRPPPFVFDPPKVSNGQLSPVIADEEETPVTPVLFGGGTILGEKAEGATQHYFERNGNCSTFVLVAPMAVATVPGFGDGIIKPTPAPNWSKITQQFEARRYLPITITTRGGLEDDGSKAPSVGPTIFDHERNQEASTHS